ncbi:hypothetical protein EJ07DRAFT_180067 [Lizonia empirigonia]|nr:hypothetical protein EJ07DRAFT_180067 [Lizonia empirigonia]
MNTRIKLPSDAARDGASVTILIGPEKTTFKLHKAFLTEHSAFFARELHPRKQAEAGLWLLDVESRTFDTFVNWLYTQTLPYSPDSLGPEDEPDRVSEVNAVKAYVFGDRFEAAGFKRAVLQVLVAFYVPPGPGGVPFFSTIIYAFNHLPGDDIFLKLLVDVQCCRYCAANDSDEELEDRKKLPYDFLMRVMLRSSEICHCFLEMQLDVKDYQLVEEDEDRGTEVEMSEGSES